MKPTRPQQAYCALLLFMAFFLHSQLVQTALTMEGRIDALYGGKASRRCRCSCGLTNRRLFRVIGGSITEFNEYPWVAALIYKGHFYCGGTLISDRYILTAAHCIRGVNVVNLKVLLGEHIRSFPGETQSKHYDVVYSVYHHLFNGTTFNNDIGLIKLSKHVDFKWHSRPACLPQPQTDYVGEIGVVAGWGKTDEDGDISDSLQEILIPVFSNDVCRSKMKYKSYEITDNMLCAGYGSGERDSCRGDSGAGLLWEGRDNKADVIGIVSWGRGCGRQGYPGVYTRVTKYLSWIAYHTRDGCFCGRRLGRG